MKPMKFVVDDIITYYSSNISWKSLVVKPYRHITIPITIIAFSLIITFFYNYIRNNNNLFMLLIIFVVLLYIFILTYCFFLSLKKYGYKRYFDFFKKYKEDPFRLYQRTVLKKYLKDNRLHNIKAMKLLSKNINFDNRVPSFDITFISLLISIFLIPISLKCLDLYLFNFKDNSENYLIELIKISIFSIGIIIVSLQLRKLFITNKRVKHDNLRCLVRLIDDIRLENLMK